MGSSISYAELLELIKKGNAPKRISYERDIYEYTIFVDYDQINNSYETIHDYARLTDLLAKPNADFSDVRKLSNEFFANNSIGDAICRKIIHVKEDTSIDSYSAEQISSLLMRYKHILATLKYTNREPDLNIVEIDDVFKYVSSLVWEKCANEE